MDTLICQHCNRCAFCAPLYDSCWYNSHLPNVHWKEMLDRMIKMPGVEGYLKNAGHDVKQVKMARAAYLKHFCKRTPPNGLLPDETPKAKRQCTLLPEGVYSESTSVDTSTHLLSKVNELSSVPLHIKLNDVITMEDVQHKDNVNIRQRIQGYCSQTLGVLVQVKEMLCTNSCKICKCKLKPKNFKETSIILWGAWSI